MKQIYTKADVKVQITEIDKQISKFWEEYRKVSERYYDNKNYCWQSGFLASEWTYYNEFLAKADYKEWNDESVCSYLNYLTARIRNLKLKKNQIKWKNFGKVLDK